MASYPAVTAYAGSASGTPRTLRAVFIAAAGLLFLLIAFGANREIASSTDSQIAQQESAFCVKLGQQPGAQYDACMQEVARLVAREQEIKSVEF